MIKKKELNQYRSKDLKELQKIVNDKKNELSKMMVESMKKADKNLKIFKNIKIEIAKISTLIREKQILAEEK